MCMENKSPYNNLHIVKDDATVTKTSEVLLRFLRTTPPSF